MLRQIAVILILALISSCDDKSDYKESYFINPEVDVVIKTENLDQLNDNLNNNIFIKHSKSESYKSSLKFINTISTFSKQQNTYITLASLKDRLVISAIGSNVNLTAADSIFKHDTISYNNQSILKLISKDTIYFYKPGFFWFASNTLNEVKHVIDIDTPFLKTNNSVFNKAFEILSKSNTTSVMLKNSNILTDSSSSSITEINRGNYSVFDLEINANQLSVHGVVLPVNDSVTATSASSAWHEISSVTPNTFQEYTSWPNNTKQDSLAETSRLSGISSVNEINLENTTIYALKLVDPEITAATIRELSEEVETFRGIKLFTLKSPINLDSILPEKAISSATFYYILNEYLFLSESAETLQYSIVNIQNKTTLNTSVTFQTLKNELTTDASLTQVVKGKPYTLLEQWLGKLPLEQNDMAATQLVADRNFYHLHSSVLKAQKALRFNTVNEHIELEINNPILTNPKFVKNHLTNQYDIVFQDINNQLYLYSNKGRLYWKVPLSGQIIGDIQQIDMYKNGKLQLAFVTQNKLYVLDRNGNTVAPFPLVFKDPITQPLSVFDYDNTKNYRLFVTQNKNLVVYNAKGKPVKGFNFNDSSGSIITQPQHFRIKSKDYIVFKTNTKLHILNRRGESRIKTKNTYKFSDEAVYNFKNTFTTTTENGTIIQFDTTGKTTTTNLKAAETHSFFAELKASVLQSENRLYIKSNKLDIGFGNYTNVAVFYPNNKMYVGLTDLQKNSIYLYDSQAKVIPGFPVFGSSEIDLINSDADTALEMVVKSDNNSVIIYKFN